MDEKVFEEILPDVGHEIVTAGILLQRHGAGGMRRSFLMMFPTMLEGIPWVKVDAVDHFGHPGILSAYEPTVEQWRRLLEQMDHQGREVEVVEADGSIAKATLRKGQRQIDSHIQWRVFRRDGFRCRYCGRDDVPLSVDHVIPWEQRGPTVEANLVSSCKKDNRVRGMMPFVEWLASSHYMEVSQSLTHHQRQANIAILETLSSIKLVNRQRSR
jgi:hypothetical protein